jgi:hypothetical protein
MATRFQTKNVPVGRLTPSNLTASTSTNATLSPSSPSIYSSSSGNESDQTYLGKMNILNLFLNKISDCLDRLKAREIISEAVLQVARIKPDDPIDFLYN